MGKPGGYIMLVLGLERPLPRRLHNRFLHILRNSAPAAASQLPPDSVRGTIAGPRRTIPRIPCGQSHFKKRLAAGIRPALTHSRFLAEPRRLTLCSARRVGSTEASFGESNGIDPGHFG